MKSLIVEDDFTARKLLHLYLADMSDCHIAINGQEAIDVFKQSIKENDRYDLICLDIMMPKVNGWQALEAIRQIESEAGIEGLERTKVIMTTAKNQPKDIMDSFGFGCEAYMVKPIRKNDLMGEIEKLGLLQKQAK